MRKFELESHSRFLDSEQMVRARLFAPQKWVVHCSEGYQHHFLKKTKENSLTPRGILVCYGIHMHDMLLREIAITA